MAIPKTIAPKDRHVVVVELPIELEARFKGANQGDVNGVNVFFETSSIDGEVENERLVVERVQTVRGPGGRDCLVVWADGNMTPAQGNVLADYAVVVADQMLRVPGTSRRHAHMVESVRTRVNVSVGPTSTVEGKQIEFARRERNLQLRAAVRDIEKTKMPVPLQPLESVSEIAFRMADLISSYRLRIDVDRFLVDLKKQGPEYTAIVAAGDIPVQLERIGAGILLGADPERLEAGVAVAMGEQARRCMATVLIGAAASSGACATGLGTKERSEAEELSHAAYRMTDGVLTETLAAVVEAASQSTAPTLVR